MRVGRREFLHRTGKYLREGTFVLTNRGVAEYIITVEGLEDIKRDIRKKDVLNVEEVMKSGIVI